MTCASITCGIGAGGRRQEARGDTLGPLAGKRIYRFQGAVAHWQPASSALRDDRHESHYCCVTCVHTSSSFSLLSPRPLPARATTCRQLLRMITMIIIISSSSNNNMTPCDVSHAGTIPRDPIDKSDKNNTKSPSPPHPRSLPFPRATNTPPHGGAQLPPPPPENHALTQRLRYAVPREEHRQVAV